MARTTLDYGIIKSCAQYAQALMLMVGVAKQVPSFKSTLKDIYPRFVDLALVAGSGSVGFIPSLKAALTQKPVP